MTIEAIWHEFKEELHKYILTKVANPQDADDIIQDTFIKVALNIDKIQHAVSIKPYIYAMVKNTMFDFMNKQSKIETIETLFELPVKEEDARLNENIAQHCLLPFIETLPEKYREALILAELQNLPQTEIAEKLNISYSGAKSRVQRGREKLKDQLLICCSFEVDKYGNIEGITKNG